MAYKNGLAERDSVRDGRDRVMRSVCIRGAFVAVFAETAASFLGPIDQCSIFIVDLSAHFGEKIFTVRCPHGRIEKLLLGSVRKSCFLHSCIGLGIEAAGAVEPEVVVFWG
jgi:hypothetical protein